MLFNPIPDVLHYCFSFHEFFSRFRFIDYIICSVCEIYYKNVVKGKKTRVNVYKFVFDIYRGYA